MNNQEKQERPATINANGNIVPKPYGTSRWASPRIRVCIHPDCDNAARVLSIGDSDIDRAHNCCTEHEGSDHAILHI